MKMDRIRAFTLIELLVVMTIIALLIAILLPSLVKARESSKDAACLGNMGAIISAQLSYTIEHKNIFTSSGEWIWGSGSLANNPNPAKRVFEGTGSPNFQNHNNDYTTREAPRYGTLSAYIDNYETHFCPIADILPVPFVKGGQPKGTEVQRTYVQNWNNGPWWTTHRQFDQETYDSISNPRDMVVHGEENTFSMGFGGNANMNDGAMGYTWDHFASFHNLQGDSLRSGFSTAGFADGHAEWIYPQAKVTYTDESGRTRTVNATEAWASDDIPNPEGQDLSLVNFDQGY